MQQVGLRSAMSGPGSPFLIHSEILQTVFPYDQWRILRGGGEPAPHFLWATDWRRHSRDSWYVTTVLYYGDTVASLSLRTPKTWYSEYSKLLWLYCGQWLSDSFRVHTIRFRPGGAYIAPQESLDALSGHTSKGKGRGERGKREGKWRGIEEKRREGRDRSPYAYSWIRPWRVGY